MILFAMISGAFAGAIMTFFSHVAPRLGAGNFVRDIDQPSFFRKTISRREAHVLGIVTHLLLSIFFAGAFALLVQFMVFPGFGLLSILGWSCVLSLVNGGIILPLEGHGVFGVKEDPWFPIDLVVTNVLWAVLFWLMMSVWPVNVSV
jgi:hypothetical protein